LATLALFNFHVPKGAPSQQRKERQETTAGLLASKIIPNPCVPRFEELLNPGGLTTCNLAFALLQQ